ncbi:glycosyltransferase involved in cell wall biosynthesis [Lutibacter oceani]|uniref:Glycosyltransferase involved in cell wall biosynthesis n=1 Tax=Lutibacter oceani TaxID=1853311 RepID=A0A3D9RT67_9FLAO|nr:glycosyltransferase [Lutibacter oceani]REE79932.1 glycosyltransferase involved in cell wall biosynthesis [Lutibacter oceani]
MTEKFKLCIVIPCYNEEKRLNTANISSFLKSQKNVLLCFVNDGSNDNTLTILHKIKDDFPNNVEVISMDKNSGKAETVRFGVQHCNTNFTIEKIAYLDADFATTLEECFEISELVNDEIVFAFGSRISKIDNNIQRKKFRHLIGRIIATFISNQLKLTVYDTQCGCKIFNAELSKSLFSEKFISKWLFDVEIFNRMIVLFGRKKMVSICKEVPLKTWIDYDESKVKITYFFKLWLDLYQIGKTYKTRKNHLH